MKNNKVSKKIFAISDVHGHFTAMINALNDSGFDENNENHLLVSLGDMFDRGEESLAVFEYLKKLKDKGRAVILRGNHEPFFIDFLHGDTNPFNYFRNGLRKTVDDFTHCTRSFEMFMFENEEKYGESYMDAYPVYARTFSKQINDEYPELLPFLEELPYYFETENHIFTHASIDGKALDWHFPECSMYYYTGWDACLWDDGMFFGSPLMNTEKNVVIGHFATRELRRFYGICEENVTDDSILIRDDGRVIALDACTIVSKKVNVYVVEDYLI